MVDVSSDCWGWSGGALCCDELGGGRSEVVFVGWPRPLPRKECPL